MHALYKPRYTPGVSPALFASSCLSMKRCEEKPTTLYPAVLHPRVPPTGSDNGHRME